MIKRGKVFYEMNFYHMSYLQFQCSSKEPGLKLDFYIRGKTENIPSYASLILLKLTRKKQNNMRLIHRNAQHVHNHYLALIYIEICQGNREEIEIESIVINFIDKKLDNDKINYFP